MSLGSGWACLPAEMTSTASATRLKPRQTGVTSKSLAVFPWPSWASGVPRIMWEPACVFLASTAILPPYLPVLSCPSLLFSLPPSAGQAYFSLSLAKSMGLLFGVVAIRFPISGGMGLWLLCTLHHGHQNPGLLSPGHESGLLLWIPGFS